MPQRSRAQRLNGLFPLSYTGVVPVSPVNFVMDDRPPTINDSKNFYIGDLWLDTSTVPPDVADLWMLVSLVGHSATWVNFGAGDLETLTGNSGGPVSPDGAGNINVVGDGTTINIVGNPGTNTLTATAVGTGLVSSLTGNSGGPVFPTAGNINVVGTGVITVVGNPGTSTLTVTPSGSIASSFITNPATGVAVPVAGVLTFAGTGGITVSAAGSTVTIAASGSPAPMVGFGAYKSATTANVTGDGTFYQIIFDGEIYDTSSNYNNATGVFTAPTDGTYHFDAYIGVNNITDQTLSGMMIETTGGAFFSDGKSPVNDKDGSNNLSYQLSVDALMTAGDTAVVKISIGGGSNALTVGVDGQLLPGNPISTYFDGHRLDPAASFISGAETFITDSGTATPNILGQVNVLTQNATLGAGSSVLFSAPGASNTIQLDLTDADDNTILGAGSGNLTMSGTGNTVLGQGSLTSITSGSTNIVIGQGAGNNLTGTETGNVLIGDPGVTGINNLFAIHIPSAGAGFVGFDMHNYPGGSSVNGANLFIGESAGNRTMTAPAWFGNIGIGTGTLMGLTTGPHNVALGSVSGIYITSGDGNVLLGHSTGANLLGGTGIVSGNRNVAIGYAAGDNWTGSDSTNICIGTNPGVLGDNRITRIGSDGSADAIQAKAFIYGIRGVTTDVNNAVAVLIDSAGQLGTVSSSMRYKSNIQPMGPVSDRLMDLDPVTFSWKSDSNHLQQIGLIAEEVEQVFPELVVHDKEGLPETVKYHELPVLLLNELKKLAARVAELESRLT